MSFRNAGGAEERHHAGALMQQLGSNDIDQLGLLTAALENAPEPIALVVIDAVDRASLSYVNRAFCDLFEFGADEIIGRSTSAVFGANTQAEHIHTLHAGTDASDFVSQRVALYTKSGAELMIEVRDRALDARHRIVSFRDLTPLHAANDAFVRANQRLESLLANNTDAAVLTIDAAGQCIDANAATQQMFGYGRGELAGTGYLRLSATTFFPNGQAFPHELMLHRPLRFTATFERADGELIACECKAVPMVVHEATEGAYLIVKDVTHTVELGKRRDRDAKRLRALYEISAGGNATFSEQVDAALALVLDAFDMEYGYVGRIEDQLIVIEHSAGNGEAFHAGVRGSELERTYLADTIGSGDVLTIADLAAAETSDDSDVRSAYRQWHGSISAPLHVDRALYGTIGFLSKNVVAFDDTDRDFIRLVASLISTVLERERRQKRLDRLAFYDALTGLANRGNFMLHLEAALFTAADTGSAFALHFIDLDGFKSVNDTFGHSEGDETLQAVARRLEDTLRGTSDIAARLGGDEFVVLQTNVKDRADALALGKRLVGALSKPYPRLAALTPALSASVGIALYPSDGDDVRILLAEADRALYRAKTSGKSRVEISKPRKLRAVR